MLTRRASMMASRSRGASRQRGLSIVELLVGVAVGLLVVAAAALLTATQLGENRRLLLETQVQQDLRAAMDTVTREVRRAGARAPAAAFVWTEAGAGQDAGTLDDATPLLGTDTQVLYQYNRFDFQGGPSGFRKNATRVQFLLPGVTRWSDLTDIRALTVSTFNVDANHQDEPMPAAPDPQQRIPCPKLCQPANDTSCWPVLKVRQFTVTVTGSAISDPNVTRTLRSTVRPRNDQFVPSAPAVVCPA